MQSTLIVGKEIKSNINTSNLYSIVNNKNRREKLKKFNLLTKTLKKAAHEKIFIKNHLTSKDIVYLFLSFINIIFFSIGFFLYLFPNLFLVIFLIFPIYTLIHLFFKKFNSDLKFNNEDNSQDIINEFRIILQTMPDEEFNQFLDNSIEKRKQVMFNVFNVKLRNNDKYTYHFLDKIIKRVENDRKKLIDNKEILLHTWTENLIYKKDRLLNKYKKWKYIHFQKNKSKIYYKNKQTNIKKDTEFSKSHSIYQENILAYLDTKSQEKPKKENTFIDLLKKIRKLQNIDFKDILHKYHLNELQYKKIIFEVIETDFYKGEPLNHLETQTMHWNNDEYKEVVFNQINTYPLAINYVKGLPFRWEKEEYKELILQAIEVKLENFDPIKDIFSNNIFDKNNILNKFNDEFNFTWDKQDIFDILYCCLKNYANEKLINLVNELTDNFTWTQEEYKKFALAAVKNAGQNLKFINSNYFENIQDYKEIIQIAIENDFQANQNFDPDLLAIKSININSYFTNKEYKQLAQKVIELNGGYALKAIDLYSINWSQEEYKDLCLLAMKDEHKRKFMYYIAGFHTLKYVDFNKLYTSKELIKIIIETSLKQDPTSYNSLLHDFKHLDYVQDFQNECLEKMIEVQEQNLGIEETKNIWQK